MNVTSVSNGSPIASVGQIIGVDSEIMGSLFPPVEYYLSTNTSSASLIYPMPPPGLGSFVYMLAVYYTPVMGCLGITGNILTAVTLTKGPFRKLSANPYLVALCLSDLCFLAWLLLDWLHDIDSSFLAELGGWCQAMIFCSYVCKFTATWFVTSLAVDRFIVLKLPTRLLWLATRAHARIVAIVITIVAIVVYLNISVLYGETDGTHRVCMPLARFIWAIQILGWVDTNLNLILPYLAIFVLSPLTLHALARHYHQRSVFIQADGTRGVTFKRRPKAEMQCTKVAVAACGVFLLMNLPTAVMRLHGCVVKEKNVGFILWQRVFIVLSSTRSTMNLPVHYAFSRAFRKAFKTRFHR